ncbi:MAG: hypothetical protein ACRCZ0_10555 [Cetobacterium sp.]
MSTTILIHDKEELPYQSLSTPKTSNERYEFSEYFQNPSQLSNQQSYKNLVLHCCYFTFFILTVTAISYGGYYCFIKSIDDPTVSTLQDSSPESSYAEKSLPSDQKLNNIHSAELRDYYKLISSSNSDNDSSDNDSSDNDSSDNDSSDNDSIDNDSIDNDSSDNDSSDNDSSDNDSSSSGLVGSKIEISDVDGDVYIGK